MSPIMANGVAAAPSVPPSPGLLVSVGAPKSSEVEDPDELDPVPPPAGVPVVELPVPVVVEALEEEPRVSPVGGALLGVVGDRPAVLGVSAAPVEAPGVVARGVVAPGASGGVDSPDGPAGLGATGAPGVVRCAGPAIVPGIAAVPGG